MWHIIESCTFCENIDGDFMIATANGSNENATSTPINCYRVTIKSQPKTLVLSSYVLPSFYVGEGAARDMKDLTLTHVKWMESEDSNALLIGTKTPAGCFMELFALVEKAIPISSFFKQNFQQPNKSDVYKQTVSICIVFFFCPGFKSLNVKRFFFLTRVFCGILNEGLDAPSELSLYEPHSRRVYV